jgi:hypothetical protein
MPAGVNDSGRMAGRAVATGTVALRPGATPATSTVPMPTKAASNPKNAGGAHR